MSVTIRNNSATELCITKGQEGTIAGWQSIKGLHRKLVLDTIFVKLNNSPQLVKFNGLPENVVLIITFTISISFKLASGWNILISREQVKVLPNFAMTDYTFQCKIRPINIVDLNNCSGHQSYYTCLSSASAANTIIIQGFDLKQITAGASGWLRQEFRELEILDEITQLKYKSLLPKQMDGHWRNTLLINFREWKGLNYVPPKTHPVIQWNEKNPLDIFVLKNIS
jgi:hypothetical protein